MPTIAELKQQQSQIVEQLRQQQAAAADLSGKIEVARKGLAELRAKLAAVLGTDTPTPLTKKAAKAPKKGSKPGAKPSQRALVTEILRVAGKAMSLDELVAAMRKNGYQFKSKTPKSALGVTLYTAKPQIQAVGGGRFKLGAGVKNG